MKKAWCLSWGLWLCGCGAGSADPPVVAPAVVLQPQPGPDASPPGARDAGMDAGPPDTGPPDTGPPDTGLPPAEMPVLPEASTTTSIGHASDGRLRGGIRLPERSPGLRSNPLRPNRAGDFATVETVGALVRAAAVVAAELPGGEVTMNDLSLERGGPMAHHGSHRNGRDVDVLFYLLDADGAPREGRGVTIDPDGRGTDFQDLSDPDDDIGVRIDVPRTWRFLEALVQDEAASVQRIFVAEHVRTMLLTHAEAVGAPQLARDRVGAVTCQPGHPHDNHLHIRFFCSAQDLGRGCIDGYPLYPWHRRALRRARARPRLGRPRPDRPRAPTTTARQARRSAGPMHESVRAHLDRRESWSTRPHPGRPWCP